MMVACPVSKQESWIFKPESGLLKHAAGDFPGSLVVDTALSLQGAVVDTALSLQGAQVWSLVGKLRFCMPLNAAKKLKTQKTKNKLPNLILIFTYMYHMYITFF